MFCITGLFLQHRSCHE